MRDERRAARRASGARSPLHWDGVRLGLVFKAFRRKLRVSEIPIDYYPRVGESKLNRFGDAWRHVKFMLLYSPSWLYFVPGLILLFLGLVGAVVLAAGPVTIFGRPWQIHTLFACIAAILLGTQIVQLGVFARAFAASHLGESDSLIEWARRRITLEHGLLGAVILLVIGLVAVVAIVVSWALNGFGALAHEYATALGFTLVAIGAQVILGSFFVSLLTMRDDRTLARVGHPADARHLIPPTVRGAREKDNMSLARVENGPGPRGTGQSCSEPRSERRATGMPPWVRHEHDQRCTFSQRISQRGPWSSTWHVVTGWAPLSTRPGARVPSTRSTFRPSQSPRPTA